jgi:hypothetical protein
LSKKHIKVLEVIAIMESMANGTGKEILAVNKDNIQQVDLQAVYFCDKGVIMAVMVPEDGSMVAALGVVVVIAFISSNIEAVAVVVNYYNSS